MFKTSTLTEWNKSKSKLTQVRFADLFLYFVLYKLTLMLLISDYSALLPSIPFLKNLFQVRFVEVINNRIFRARPG